MIIQSKKGYCGAAAIVNALRCLGKEVTEKRVAKLAGTTSKHGTSWYGMMTAIQKLGFRARARCWTKGHNAIETLNNQLEMNRPVILCFDEREHVVVCIGRMGKTYIIIDSTGDWWNYNENGVRIMKKDDLLLNWKAADWEGTGFIYDSISISKG